MNAILPTCGFTASSADPNLYLHINGILILLYVDDISMSYPEASPKAVIKVKAKLSEKYTTLTLDQACQLLGIVIYS